MHPVLFSIFGYPVHTYAVMIATGFVVGVFFVAREAPRFGYDREMVLDLLWWLLVMGLVGSRLAFIVTNWEQYYYPCVDFEYYNTLKIDPPLTEPDCFRLVRFWQGGLVFYGAPIASLLTLFVFMKREKLPALPVADLIIPYLALGQAFGRLGCLGAGCCFGKTWDGPWAIQFPRHTMPWDQHVAEHLITPAAELSLPVHPTQFYDFVTGMVLFAALLWVRRRRRFDRQVMVSWLLLYPVARSLNELFRGDEDRKFVTEIVVEPLNRLLGLEPGAVTFLSTSQFISIGVIAVGVVLWRRLRTRPLTPAAEIVAAAADPN